MTDEKTSRIAEREVTKSHECWVYHSPKPIRDVLCEDCAAGSKPRKPKTDRQVKALSRGIAKPVTVTRRGCPE